MKLAQARIGMAVRYVPGHAHGDLAHGDCEDGRISSMNDDHIFVRFNKRVAVLGWEGTTGEACDPAMLVPVEAVENP